MFLGYFCIISIMIYIDRGSISALLSTLQNSSTLSLSDFEAGTIGSAFMFGLTLSSPLFAYFSQVLHPIHLITIGMSIWGAGIFITALSRGFWTLVIARTLAGIGNSGFLCLASPIILRIAPTQKKNL